MNPIAPTALAVLILSGMATAVAQPAPATDRGGRHDRPRERIERRAVDCVISDTASGATDADRLGDPLCDMLRGATRRNPNADYAGPPPGVVHAGGNGRSESSATLCGETSTLISSDGCRPPRH